MVTRSGRITIRDTVSLRYSCEAGEQLSKALNPRQGPEHQLQSRFFVIVALPQPVMVQRSDFRIRVNGICQAFNWRSVNELSKISKLEEGIYWGSISQ